MNRMKKWIIAAAAALMGAGTGCVTASFKGLMTWEEYDRQPRREPYVLEIDCGQGQLLYYGSFHSTDISRPQFQDIERKWNAFKPEVALSEGGFWPLAKTREDAIRLYGEQGLLRFLANRDHVPLRCLDATLVEQARFLVQNYPPDQVKIFFVLRQAAIESLRGWTGEDIKPIQKVLDNISRWPYLNDNLDTVSDVAREVRKRFPELAVWQKVPAAYFLLPELGDFLPGMFRAVNSFRDQQMLREVLAEMKRGRRVFALVGRSHVPIQTPVLLAELPGEVLHNGPVADATDL